MAYGSATYGFGHFVPNIFDTELPVFVLGEEDVTQPIINHDLFAQARLLEQYKDSDIKSLISALFGVQVQNLEDAIQTITPRLDINAGESVQLDSIGAIVGESRKNTADAMYKYLIKSRIAENISNGTIEDVLKIWALITVDQDVYLAEHFPGEIALVTTSPVDEDYVNVVFDALQRVAGAGIPVTYIQVYESEGAFGFEDSGADTEGFGDAEDPTIGGTASYLQISL